MLYNYFLIQRRQAAFIVYFIRSEILPHPRDQEPFGIDRHRSFVFGPHIFLESHGIGKETDGHALAGRDS